MTLVSIEERIKVIIEGKPTDQLSQTARKNTQNKKRLSGCVGRFHLSSRF